MSTMAFNQTLARLMRWASGALAVALALAGCGGGSDAGNVTPSGAASAQSNPVAAFALAQQSVVAPAAMAAAAAASGNLVANGGFESGTSNWTNWGNAAVVTGQASSGTSSLSVGPGAGGAGQQVTGIVPGDTYRLTAQGKVSAASETAYVGVNFIDSSGIPFTQNSVLVTSTNYTTASLDVVAPPNAVGALVYVWKNAGNGLASLDDFTFVDVGGAAPQLNSSGNMVTNGGFESGLADWIDWGSTGTAPNPSPFGNTAAQVGPGAGGFGQDVRGIVAGSSYRLSATAKVSTAAEIGYLGVMFTDDAGNGLRAQNVVFRSTSYSRVQADVTAPVGATRALVFVWKNAGGGSVNVDDLVLVQVAPSAAPGGPAVLSVVSGTARTGVAVLDTGTRVAAWNDDNGVHAQTFDANGGLVGSPVLIAPSGTFNGVAALGGGGYVVEYSQPGAVLVQIVSASGGLAGAPITVRTEAQVEAAGAASLFDPKLVGAAGVYPLAGGGFVALYAESHLVHIPYDTPVYGFAQRFDASGNAVGSPGGYPPQGSVAATPTGGLITGEQWLTWTPNGGRAVFGVVDGALKSVASYTSPFGEYTTGQYGAGLQNGTYIAIWTAGKVVRGQLFAPDPGSPSNSRMLGPVVTFADAAPYAHVTALAGGGFLLSWGASAQAFDQNAQPVSGVMQILYGTIAATPDGGVVVVTQVGNQLVEQQYAVGQ